MHLRCGNRVLVVRCIPSSKLPPPPASRYAGSEVSRSSINLNQVYPSAAVMCVRRGLIRLQLALDIKKYHYTVQLHTFSDMGEATMRRCNTLLRPLLTSLSTPCCSARTPAHPSALAHPPTFIVSAVCFGAKTIALLYSPPWAPFLSWD